MTADHVTTAIKLGAAGFRVFPLHMHEGKVCRINGWPEKASTDAQAIVDTFAGREVVAIGVATGDDVTVVDLDVPGERHTHDGRASLKSAGVHLPKTLTIRTSGGGEHLIYRTAGGAKKTDDAIAGPNGEALPGVDVRGAGGYFKVHDAEALLAGARQISDTGGMPWLPLAGERSARTEKPSDFLEEVRRRERNTWGRNAPHSEAAIAAVEAFRKKSPNIGHGDLLELQAAIADVISSGAPGGAWAAGAARGIYVDNAPRGGDWGQAFDAAFYGLDKLRLPLRTVRISKRERLAAQARKREKAAQTKKVKAGKPRSLSDLMAREFPPQGWVVAEMIPEGTSLFVSAPKVGKSLLALDVGLAAATGRDAFGSVPTGDPRPVLYLDLESGERRLQTRVVAQGWDEFGTFRYHLDAATAIVVLERFMHKNRGKRPLGIVDTLAAIMTDRGDKTQQYKHEYDSLKRLQTMTASDPGSAILIVHHTRKLESSDPLAMASGTHGTTGAVDHVFVLVRPDRMRTDGVLSRVSRDVENAEFELRLQDARWTAVGGSAEDAQQAHERREHERRLANLGPLKNGLLQVLEHADGATLSLDTIFERYDGASDRDTVGKALRSLSEAGLIEKVGRGAYMAAMVMK